MGSDYYTQLCLKNENLGKSLFSWKINHRQNYRKGQSEFRWLSSNRHVILSINPNCHNELFLETLWGKKAVGLVTQRW